MITHLYKRIKNKKDIIGGENREDDHRDQRGDDANWFILDSSNLDTNDMLDR